MWVNDPELARKWTKKYGSKPVSESITIPIKKGDRILGGKFKNREIIVKSISKNEKGDITINGNPILRVRIPTKMKEADSSPNYPIDNGLDNKSDQYGTNDSSYDVYYADVKKENLYVIAPKDKVEMAIKTWWKNHGIKVGISKTLMDLKETEIKGSMKGARPTTATKVEADYETMRDVKFAMKSAGLYVYEEGVKMKLITKFKEKLNRVHKEAYQPKWKDAKYVK
jgi:hypothetical protein